MSAVFGIQQCRLNDGEEEVVLHHSIKEPNFESATIVHTSCLTGARKYSKMNSYFSTAVTAYLMKYPNAKEIAKTLQQMEGKIVTFIFAPDGGLVQQMFLESVEIFPLEKPNSEDVAKLKLKNTNFVFISRRLRTKQNELLKNEKQKFIRTQGIIL